MTQKGIAHIYLVVLGLLVLGIGAIATGNNKTPAPAPSPQLAQVSKLTPQTSSPADLEKYLTVEAALLGVADNISLYYKDLAHPQDISIEPTRSWIPASTIKSYVVLEAFRQRDLGLIDFNQTITIKGNNVVPTELETDDFTRLREGTQATIKQLVEAMITQSDNTAYNSLGNHRF